MKPFSFFLMFGMAVSSVSAWGNRVLSVTSNEEQVTLTNEATSRRWQLNESVCLIKGDKELACGYVGRLTEKTLVVKVESRSYKVAPGYDVTLQREQRYPASTTSSEMAVAKGNPIVDISAGPIAGWNYLFAMVPQVQVAVSRTFSLGIDLRYAQSTNLGISANALGGMLSLNYFHSHYAFRGLIFTLGVGTYGITLSDPTTTESSSPIAVEALVGWRGKPHWGLPIDIGISGGLQYVTGKASGTFVNKFSGVLPALSVYFGYSL